MIIYQNTKGIECVAWTDENGVEYSMLKSTWDELEVQREQNGTL